MAIWPTEPTADPLQLFLQSLHCFMMSIQAVWFFRLMTTLFMGRQRAQVLARHHQERLEETLALCECSKTALEVLNAYFRALDPHQVFFAMGET